MKSRSIMLLVLAIALGLGATWMANRWLQARLTPGTTEGQSTPIVVAALEIPFGQKVEAAHVKTINWPTGEVPPGSFNDPAQVLGKVASGKIFPNEVIVAGRVVDQTGGSTLASVITPTLRAVTVRVNDVIGVAGFLLPGNRVDVIATRKEQNDRRSITETVLQDLKVLAVDQTASPDKDKPVVVRAVTLEMNPAQAETLVKATDEGTVQLSLRNPKDSALVPLAKKPEPPPPPPVVEKPVEKKVVEAPPPPPALVVKPSHERAVVVIRGMEEEKVRFDL